MSVTDESLAVFLARYRRRGIRIMTNDEKKTTVINHRRYSVEYRFNMVGNWVFTDKDGIEHLVDGEDVSVFGGAGERVGQFEYDDPQITVQTAIDYAKHLAGESEDGVFWWKVKEY